VKVKEGYGLGYVDFFFNMITGTDHNRQYVYIFVLKLISIPIQ